MEALIVFASQMALVFLKHLNVRVISNHRVAYAVMLTGAIQAAWLIGSALGIKGFLNGDPVIVGIYIVGGMVGSYLNFKIRVH